MGLSARLLALNLASGAKSSFACPTSPGGLKQRICPGGLQLNLFLSRKASLVPWALESKLILQLPKLFDIPLIKFPTLAAIAFHEVLMESSVWEPKFTWPHRHWPVPAAYINRSG